MYLQRCAADTDITAASLNSSEAVAAVCSGACLRCWSHETVAGVTRAAAAAAAVRAQAARVQDSGRQRVSLNLESCVHLGAETQQQHWRSSGARRAKTCELVSLYMRQNYLILLNNINNNNKNEWINQYLSRKPPNVLFLQPHSWRQYNIWDTLHLKNGDGEMTPIENT